MRRIKQGDNVVVIAGRDKGKRGEVTRTIGAEQVVVAGVNQVKRHTKPNPMRNQPGGIVAKEMPIHVSNVALWCKDCGATRAGYRFDESGEKRRTCRKCGGDI